MHRRSVLRLLLAALTLPVPLRAQATSSPDTAAALHLLSRATFGVRPADLGAVLAQGLDAWVDAQLRPGPSPDSAVHARFPAVSLSMEEAVRQYAPRRDTASMDSSRARRPNPQRLLADLVTARVYRAATSERQLEEVMAEFWFNHFNVFFGKGATRYLVADYERTAIRPHVFGRFEDMLLATARHPAMLFYLDNWQSVAVDTTLPRVRAAMGNAARRAGLNENYARELLELHTLGVDGGYTQEDVIAVARAFTGWTFPPPRLNAPERTTDVRFTFRPQLHDRAEKVVLGTRLPAGRGEQDGRDVIRLLAAHPRTAQFIAHKLVERFVSDAGDAALEAELADVFQRTRGDLRAVTRALFTSPRFQAAEHRGTKVKTPFELVASALRVTHAEIAPSRRLIETLRAMGQMPYGAAEPTGFPASSEDWVNGGAMLARMNFALEFAAGRVDNIRPGGSALRNAVSGSDPLPALAALFLPGRDTRTLQRNIVADLAKQAEQAPRARVARAAGLLLGSPEFQRR